MVPPVARITTCAFLAAAVWVGPGRACGGRSKRDCEAGRVARKERGRRGLLMAWGRVLSRRGSPVAHSNGLSLGALNRACTSSDIGQFRFRPLGGMGAWNHLA